MHEAQRVTLGILAGGHGRRLGGRDKGCLVLGGKTQVGRVVDEIGSLADEVLISAAENPYYHQHFASRLVCDPTEDAGPAVGIGALLAACETERLIVVAIDIYTPLRQSIATLMEDAATDGACHGLDHEGHHLPIALLHRCNRGKVHEYLDAGQRSLRGLFNAVGSRPVRLREPCDDIDTPAALSSARHSLAISRTAKSP